MEKKYIVLVNLGTPAAPTRRGVWKYLFEFLMDRFVIDIPFLYRLFLVGGIIAPFRSKGSSAAYRSIWLRGEREGSPLLVLMEELRVVMERRIRECGSGGGARVLIGMRYGEPSIRRGLGEIYEDMQSGGIKKASIQFLLMYPHYAFSTTVTAIRNIELEVLRLRRRTGVREGRFGYKIYPVSYYGEENYLEALAQRIRPYLRGKWDHLLFSYHGIPERHLKKFPETEKHCLGSADCCVLKTGVALAAHEKCYLHQVRVTTRHLVERLGVGAGSYSLSFQSRLGKDPWLRPYTFEVIRGLGERGVKNLLVVCPAFTVDNLETLFEIEIENREIFIGAGGGKLTLIPCLNTHPMWVKALLGYAGL